MIATLVPKAQLAFSFKMHTLRRREMPCAMLTAFFPSLLQTKTHLFTSPVWESFRWAPATTWQDAYDGEEATKENPCGRFST